MSETPSSKISELPAVVAANLLETDVFAAVANGITSKVALSELRSKLDINGEFNVKHPAFGAIGNGVADDRAAIQSAIAAALILGGTVRIPAGTYDIGTIAGTLDAYANGLVVSSYTNPGASPANRIRIIGAGPSTILKGTADNMVIVRWSAEKCSMSDLTIDGDNRTGIIGLGVMGPNSASTVATDSQTHNYFDRIYTRLCSTGTLLKASGAGLVAYNRWRNCDWTGNLLRAIYNTDANSTTAPRSNRNEFHGKVNGPTNTGIEIARGDTNKIMLDFEDITSGVTPNATPTAIVILVGDASQNQNNSLIDVICEGCTRDLDCNNRRTNIVGGLIDAAKTVGITVGGIDTIVGSGDFPNRLRDLIIGAVSQDAQLELTNSAIIFPATQVSSADVNGLDDYEEGTWTPVPHSLAVVGAPTYTGTYTKIGRRMFCTMKILSSTSTASTKNSTSFTGLPYTVSTPDVCSAVDNVVNSLGNGLVLTDNNIYTPTWAATALVYVSFSYDSPT